MRERTSQATLGPLEPGAATRALVVTSVFGEREAVDQIGREAYSYHFVYQAFAPLLRRWGEVVEITRAESRLDYSLWRIRERGVEPIHLSFLPLHLVYPSSQAPNVAFPFWEYPDIPNQDFDNNPRNNWVRVANRMSMILTASGFTRDAFSRGGVRTPVRVVPVPIRPEYFDIPDHRPGERARIDSPVHVFPSAPPAPVAPDPWRAEGLRQLGLRAGSKYVYRSFVKPHLPSLVERYVSFSIKLGRMVDSQHRHTFRLPPPDADSLELSGVVYTSFVNPFDPRKNWQDLLSAFLIALGDQEDATLILKLVVPPELSARGLNGILQHYRGLGLRHRCKLVFLTSYLSDAQLVELTRLSTYYVSAARAEGACLPLQDFLAAGRPAIAPVHTAMADYFDRDVGFVVDSHLEPTWWAHDPSRSYNTTWHRIVWQSLFDQLRDSYRVATLEASRYAAMAARGRERIADFASAARVWPRLRSALDEAATIDARPGRASPPQEPTPDRDEVSRVHAALR